MTALNCCICGKAISPEDGDGSLCGDCAKDEALPLAPGSDELNPKVPLTLLLACITAAGFYGIVPLLLFRDTFVFHLFSGHGWVPYACVLLFCFALWTMLLKIPLVNRQ